MKKLTGKELATKVQTLIKKGFGLSASAIECGYYSEGHKDNKIPATTPFTRELLKAAGFEFPGGARGSAMGECCKRHEHGNSCLIANASQGFEPSTRR